MPWLLTSTISKKYQKKLDLHFTAIKEINFTAKMLKSLTSTYREMTKSLNIFILFTLINEDHIFITEEK